LVAPALVRLQKSHLHFQGPPAELLHSLPLPTSGSNSVSSRQKPPPARRNRFTAVVSNLLPNPSSFLPCGEIFGHHLRATCSRKNRDPGFPASLSWPFLVDPLLKRTSLDKWSTRLSCQFVPYLASSPCERWWFRFGRLSPPPRDPHRAVRAGPSAVDGDPGASRLLKSDDAFLTGLFSLRRSLPPSSSFWLRPSRSRRLTFGYFLIIKAMFRGNPSPHSAHECSASQMDSLFSTSRILY